MTKTKLVTIPVGTYSTHLYVFVGGNKDRAANFYNKNCHEVNWNWDEGDPTASTLISKYSRGVVIWFRDNPPKLTTIQHECLHAAWFIIESTGCDVKTDTQEVLAYLQEYLFARIAIAILPKNLQKQI